MERTLEGRLRALENWRFQHDAENEALMQNYEDFRKEMLEGAASMRAGLEALKNRMTLLVIVALVVVLGANAGIAEVFKALLK